MLEAIVLLFVFISLFISSFIPIFFRSFEYFLGYFACVIFFFLFLGDKVVFNICTQISVISMEIPGIIYKNK